jgi:hypothetical protein
LIYLIIGVFLCSGCVTQKKCLAKFPPGIDSVYIEKLKEIPVYLPGDTINITVPVNCPDQDVALVENVKLRQVIRILNGKLQSVIQIKPDTIKVYTTQIKEVIKEKPVPVKYVPKFYKWCRDFSLGVIVIILLYIAYRIVKWKKII